MPAGRPGLPRLLGVLLLLCLWLPGCVSAPTRPADAAPRATLWPPEGGAIAGVGAPEPSCAAWPCQVRDPLVPGMVIDAAFSEGDGWHRLDLVASNDGRRSYWMSSACDFHPWAESLIDKDGRRLEAREEPPADDDPAGCLECDVVEFAPGGILRHSAVFNETFWHPDGYAVPARPGTYAWTLSLYLWTDSRCTGDGGYPGVTVDVVVPAR